LIMKKLEKQDFLILIIIILFVFLIIPVTVFRDVFSGYFTFIDTWTEKPIIYLKKQIVSKTPEKHSVNDERLSLPDFKFVRFEINIKADDVYVIGDFNKWKHINNLTLKKNIWETEIPLVSGRYRYLFLVDGKEILDPMNPEIDYYDGKKVSVVEVK
jgi:hypothetical protein